MTDTTSTARGPDPRHEGCLLTQPETAHSGNCLTRAIATARPGADEIVFMVPRGGAEHEGHVVLRDIATRTVREAGVPVGSSAHDLDDYAASHDFVTLGAAHPADLRALVALPVAARAMAAHRVGGTLAAVAHRRFGIAVPPPVLPRPPAPPAGGSSTDGQDTHVNDWLNALGGSVSQSDKDALAQTANDAQTLKKWFDAHDRGDPALNDMPQNVSDAENRLLSNASVGQQIHVGDAVTRDGLGDFIGNLDKAADSAKSSFQSFQKNNKDADAGEVGAAAQASILQADLPILDASGSPNAKVDGTFNLDDLKAVAGSSDAGVPDPLKKAAQTYTSSFDAFAKAGDAGDGLVNDKGLGKVVSDGIGLSRQDSAVHDWLDDLGDAVSDDDKKSLAQVGDDATTLKAWFDAHDRGDPALNDMPQNVADAENRLLGNDAVKKRIEVSSGDDKGTVTRDALGDFLGDLDKAAGSAKGSWDSFKGDNKTPDPVSLHMAADASIMQANLPILDAAGSDNAKVDGNIDLADVEAIAASGDKSPSALASAAKIYANNGEFSKLDIAGDDPSTATDGLVANNNFDAFLAHNTSKSEDDTIASLKNDAIQQAVKDAGGDASKVNGDYFKDPSSSKASGADKTAAIVQLSQTIARYNAGEQTWVSGDFGPAALSSPDQYHQDYGDGPTPGETRDQFIKDVQSRITTLTQDKDVQSFLSDKMPAALQRLVSGDPGLKASIQKQFDASSDTKALQAAFDAKDKDGKPLTTTAALSSFLDKPNFYAQALGTTPDFSKAFDDAPQDIKDKITQGYDNITSGKEIDDLTKSGTPQDQALIQAAVDKTVYDSVLDKDTVQDGTDKFNDATGKLGRAQLTDGKSGDDLLKGLGVSGVDDPKLTQFVEDNLDALAKPGKDQPPASEILSAVRQINDAMRGGLKFDDAVAKVKKDWKPQTGTATDAYKAGVFHGASALLLAGAMGARLGTSGGNSNPLQTAQQSLGSAGLLAEGGGKYLGSNGDWKGLVKQAQDQLNDAKLDAALPGADPERLTQAQNNFDFYNNFAKDVENVGKTVGGVAGNALGLISGAIGAAASAKNGDIGNAAAQGIFAGLNGISAIASAGEVATYIAPRVAAAFGEGLTDAGAAAAGIAGGVFGIVGGVVGGVAAIGGLIYAIVSSIKADEKKAADEDSWYKQLQDGFAPAGLTVPDEGTLVSAPNGYVPDDNPPAPAY